MADGLRTSQGVSTFPPTRATRAGSAFGAEPAFGPTSPFRAGPSFRADTDQAGEWYVWTRLATNGSAIGWATMQRCESRELALRLADDLNQRSLRLAV